MVKSIEAETQGACRVLVFLPTGYLRVTPVSRQGPAANLRTGAQSLLCSSAARSGLSPRSKFEGCSQNSTPAWTLGRPFEETLGVTPARACACLCCLCSACAACCLCCLCYRSYRSWAMAHQADAMRHTPCWMPYQAIDHAQTSTQPKRRLTIKSTGPSHALPCLLFASRSFSDHVRALLHPLRPL